MKPLLLGMNNPLSDDPRYDLFPYPPGCTGHRLLQLLSAGTTRGEYMQGFERRNLLHQREWDPHEALRAAERLLPDLDGRFVVVLGSAVRAALGLSRVQALTVSGCVRDGIAFSWLAFPHPSGRNLWYNDPGNREAAGRALYAVMRGEVPCAV